jgi:hypothetical protein
LKLKLISCEVLEREAAHCSIDTDFDIDIEYTEKSAHEKPELLRSRIQDMIDNSTDYDAVLLGFGLCGNALNGIKAGKCRLIVPRAHDCCTLFLGSKEKFNNLFEGRESMPWGSTGYCEKDGDYLRTSDTGTIIGYDRTYEQYVDEYGEENAKFIWETLHPARESNDVIFIKIPETYDHSVYKEFEKEMVDNGKVISMEEGSLAIIRKLLSGKWDNDFLIVEPGKYISALYDKEEIVRSELA